MKKLIFLAALFASGTANAECLQWGRDLTGYRVCMVDDAVNRNPITPETAWSAPLGRALPEPGGAVTSGRALKCPDGYSMVYTGRPMCARDLREPE